jgi:Bacterial regulatory helix-turn-helix protein, lysR family
VLYLDPAWLREQYLTQHRTLNDIAAQLGFPVHIVNRFAREHGIPIRARGGLPLTASAALRRFPPGLPEPLRLAITGRSARARLRHLLAVAGHPSLHHAALALGVRPSVIYSHITRLEQDCGGMLVNRSPRPPGTGILTPLGRQLCDQASEYLDPAASPPAPAPE